ncbi:Acid phosphatase [Penicillium oxalicum]|uniref:Acid phosphatase n=1 Tax=Penicillium oxalicum TaxID=69781 RepID=UPI0020B7D588|nr:Acid phosphatase [Penicillium oxalicum]KAI2788812.1 Acid phosphatase [Penicillium oxalicum]
MKAATATLLAAASLTGAQLATISEPSISEINQAAATTLSESPTSDVKGVAFDRFYQVWLENTDYDDVEKDANMQWLASQGILLTNYYAVTHPSEPNYCAAAGGDTFGMDNDKFQQIPANVSTIADLLDTKAISWAEYQEHMPYPGFQGFNYSNQKTYHNDYVRKHNPLILYDSIAQNETRARQIKNFTDFDHDLSDQKLPQWAFITPNMTNDAHDTNITFAGKWERSWMSSLLKNDYFMKNSLILLTFDEDDTYNKTNRVFSVLVGGAVPDHLKGTKDDTFYTHYSTIASVSANWGLPSLGRWDCGANIFEIVANKTGYANYEVDITNLRLNETYPGPLSAGEISKYSAVWPVPLTDGKCSAGHGVLDLVKKTFAGQSATYNYSAPYPWDAKSDYNTKVTVTRTNSTNTSASSTSGLASSTPSLPANGAGAGAVISGPVIVAGALAACLACLL